MRFDYGVCFARVGLDLDGLTKSLEHLQDSLVGIAE